MKERDTQKAILDYLAAKRILAFRMNTGAMKLDERFLARSVDDVKDRLGL